MVEWGAPRRHHAALLRPLAHIFDWWSRAARKQHLQLQRRTGRQAGLPCRAFPLRAPTSPAPLPPASRPGQRAGGDDAVLRLRHRVLPGGKPRRTGWADARAPFAVGANRTLHACAGLQHGRLARHASTTPPPWQGNTTKLIDDIGACKPTMFIGVPRIFDRIHSAVTGQISKAGAQATAGRRQGAALRVATRWG